MSNKKQTLKEIAVNYWAEGAWDNRDDFTDGFVEGANWQQERMYSEEEVLELLHKRMIYTLGEDYREQTTLQWFEEFKKETYEQ